MRSPSRRLIYFFATVIVMALGFGFLWTDLVCYTVGIALGALADRRLLALIDPVELRPGDH